MLHVLESLLESHGQHYFVIPFNLTEYSSVNYWIDYGSDHINLYDSLFDKLLYVTNQNNARNEMIEFGQNYSPENIDWILPWDGNCYLHMNAYHEIYQKLLDMPPNLKYAATLMDRVTENESVLLPTYDPEATEEPQIIFHKTALGRFNPSLPYGKRNKVDFIIQLNLERYQLTRKGKKHESVSPPIPDLPINNTSTPGQIQTIGFVTRLSSGRASLEENPSKRHRARGEAVANIASQLETRVVTEVYGFRPGQLMFYEEAALERDRQLYRGGDAKIKSIVDDLLQLARRAQRFGPWSVTDKPDGSVAMSGDKHDYIHVASNNEPSSSETAKDLNHESRTQLYGLGSDNNDRVRLHEMLHNTTILGLAYYVTGKQVFAKRAARSVRSWFLTAETRMNPHMKYAHFDGNSRENTGSGAGLLGFRDIYFLLDAIRIIERDGFLTQNEQNTLHIWFVEYLDWLESTYALMAASSLSTIQWIYFDLQSFAIAAFIQDATKMTWYAERSIWRLRRQMEGNGIVHGQACEDFYTSLVGWSTLSRMTQNVHRNIWTVAARNDTQRGANGTMHLSLLCQAAKSAVSWFGVKETTERWWPLLLEIKFHCPLLRYEDKQWPFPWSQDDAPMPPNNPYEMPNHFHPHESIAPFWNLGLRHGNKSF